MNFKILVNVDSFSKRLLVLNDKPVNLNKGYAKKVLDETLSSLEKRKSPFIDYGVLRLERIPETDNIKITSKLENPEKPYEFIISQNSATRSYALENMDTIDIPKRNPLSSLINPNNRILDVKEKLYNAFDFIKNANKIFKPFQD